ncbi:MAG: rhodanese-like domain-containing protein [Proteobacteria bacterium]|nr:rhodanese-like domain-containing protein [Pseudomonadota bacterium]
MTLRHGFKKMIAEANAVIETVAVKDAIALVGEAGYTFIDIREAEERAKGTIPGSVHAPRGFLEFHADPESAAHNPVFSSGDRLILFCASGGRSALAAKTLVDMGFEDVCHVAGGMAAWREADGPVD